MFSLFSKNAIVPLLLRLALAVIFIYHGLSLITADTQWGANWMPESSGQPAAAQLAAAWGQLIGGIALGVGLLTRLAAVGIIGIMVGAILIVHLPKGFDIRQGGFEYNFALIVMCLCLVLGGAGPFAVDRFARFGHAKS